MQSTNRLQQRLTIVFSLGQILTAGLMGRAALGQEPTGPAKEKAAAPASTSAPTAQTHPNNPELWNTEQMMQEAVLQISRRYNLNKDQEEYTRLLLVKRVTAFMELYESDVRELLKESIDLRLGKKAGTPEAYAKWALRAAPIYAEAQKAILDGNAEWGAILTEEQKKIHDNDLAQMRTNFQNVDRLLDGWQAGKGPGFVPQGGQTIQSGNEAVAQGRVSDPQPPVVQTQVEDNWLAYVNKFISTYNLDDKQKIAARDKIYKDIRDEVIKYREKKKEDFATLDAELLSPKPKLKRQEIERRRNELERPIQEKFVLLDSRLRQLVDRKQLADAKPDDKRQLEAWFKMLSGQVGSKKPAQPDAKNPEEKPVPPAASPKTDKPAPKPADEPNKAPAKPEEAKAKAEESSAPS